MTGSYPAGPEATMNAPKERLDVAAGEETSHILSGLTSQLPDRDPEETAEWVESLDALIREQGTERAQFIMRSLLQRAGSQSVGVPMVTTTDYVNTIPADQEAEFPGNEEFERRYRAYMRWNAAVMVHRAQRADIGVGGHISTYAGAATLYEVGFNHFFRGKDHPSGGTRSSSRATRPRACTPGRSWKAGSRRRTWTGSGRKSPSRATPFPPTRTRA
ncbi:pyruvate dehydrogenase E1 component [Arthrobacter sp. Hiyo8]|nr:pyruvate dehydrogenase E1 component [Arthrobacter sp. Hiyo8]